jgi:hypothetical protein
MSSGDAMTAVQTIYSSHPYALWLSLAGMLAGVGVTVGSPLPVWAAVAAAAAAVFSAVSPELGLGVEVALFATTAAVLVGVRARRAVDRQASAAAPPAARSTHPARLIGRIARSSGDFANGVGRVWIDGAEWAAELEGSGDALAPGRPVRIVRVLGGARLQVHPLAA